MKCENCGYYYYNEEYGREMCNFPPVDSLYSTPWDVAPCEEEEHEEPSDDPELWADDDPELMAELMLENEENGESDKPEPWEIGRSDNMTKWLVNIINRGVYEVEVKGNEVHVNYAYIHTWDGEFWTIDVDKEEDEPIQIPQELLDDESFEKSDLWDLMTCVVIPHLGCSGDDSWMDIA